MDLNLRPDDDLNFDESDNDDAVDSSTSETYLVGFIVVNIVGLQYYRGDISGREMVGFVREPLNVYDENAIKVVNTRGVQVGHVEKKAAAVLAPLIDSNCIIVEGIVPNKSGKNTNRFKIPCQIHVFARIEGFSSVKSAISSGGLELICDDSASFALSDAVAVKENRVCEEVGSLDEIFKLANENASEQVDMEPLDPPKCVIKSELFAHQKEALRWMVQREISNELPPFWKEKDGVYVNALTNYQTNMRPEPLRGGILADDMGLGKTLTLLSLIAMDKCGTGSHPCDCQSSGNVDKSHNADDSYGRLRGFDGRKIERGHSYVPGSSVNTDTSEEVNDKYGRLGGSGGRKTKRGRSSVPKSSINANKSEEIDDNRDRSGDFDVRKTKRGRKGNRDDASSEVRSKIDGSNVGSSGSLDLSPTLIVCPPSVFSNWVNQLCEHTRRGSLKMYMYHGERTNDPEELKKYDIVLTSYSTLRAEKSQRQAPLKKIEWMRIILDEGHVVKNSYSQQSQAVRELNAKRRWVVTGTPIQNGIDDLFSILAFLRFDPFCIKAYWNNLVWYPLKIRGSEGLHRLQVIMSTISLRRTKDKHLVGLPSKSVSSCYVELSSEAREIYDQIEKEAKSILRNYIKEGSVLRNYSCFLAYVVRLRQICTDVALCPPDITSLLHASIEDVSNNPDLLKKMASQLQDGEDLDCPICIAPPSYIVITRCGHIFCRPCITKTLKYSTSGCPMCRHPLTESDLYSAPPPDPSDAENSEAFSKSLSNSPKVSALLKFLSESRVQKPGVKSIVFSQFQKMLVLLEKPLNGAGFKTVRLDGTMSAKKRAQVIQEFSTVGPEAPTVLLASLKASSVGINLTCASNVYMYEPWWNPAVEEQAMDRVYRIGQKEEVKVVRLVTRNTIEEQVLELQEKKKKTAMEALLKRSGGDKGEDKMADLCTLMSL